MKIIVTRSTFIGGRLVEASPEPVEVSEADAKQLVSLGKALIVPPKPAPVSVETDAAEAAPVAAETPAEAAPAPAEKPKGKGK